MELLLGCGFGDKDVPGVGGDGGGGSCRGTGLSVSGG